ncbi:GCN5-related N-acetyltransferase 5, chloroplastic [Magnolia sinica]|uniref:GCN5-related N-acetyltransferase 5, chloroplastic n=1 Tax=Magnolia sinica TaxID=86752 RepID=UPI0026593FDD|nr:GCN5-related N-acetyltransferase 5, chloroplastic [Magnolia sinica]
MATTTTTPLSLPFSSLDSSQPSFLPKTTHHSFLTPNKPLSLSYTPSFPSYPAPTLSKFHLLKSHHSSYHSSSSYSLPNNPLPTGLFLSPDDIEKKGVLERFEYFQRLPLGSLTIRSMGDRNVEATIGLLANSFAESMSVPSRLVAFLTFLVKQYVTERRALLPHAVMLIGFYKGEDGTEELAGTVEISFNARGANASSPTPVPPRDFPYICNMAVKETLRRRGIGWNLLKASEQLISEMTTSRDVYLHCRMIDKGPLQMYIKADYKIVKTDSLLTLLKFQRRKHLMHKTLPESDDQSYNWDSDN